MRRSGTSYADGEVSAVHDCSCSFDAEDSGETERGVSVWRTSADVGVAFDVSFSVAAEGAELSPSATGLDGSAAEAGASAKEIPVSDAA